MNFQLYNEFRDADDAWIAAIRNSLSAKKPEDLRYSRVAQGEPGSPLRAAYDARNAACKAWSDAIQETRLYK